MEQLLEAYSISEIILFIVLLAGAVKWIVTMWDWGKSRLQQGFQKEFKQDACDQAITKQLGEISKQLSDMHITHKQDQAKINDRIKELNATINTLMASDRDDIKSWITEKHHYFCYEKGVIDVVCLDCIEKRYGHYVEEGGNSYVATLMREIRMLPKVSVFQDWDENTMHKEVPNNKE